MTALHPMHPRATRFPLEAPVRYRGIGEPGWHSGLTLNASRTGVLVTGGDAGLELRDRVEFVLLLPRIEGAHAGAEVRCTGGVVRFEGSASSMAPCETTFALTIDGEEFGRSEREWLTAYPQASQNDA
jgi:hypothetical protein